MPWPLSRRAFLAAVGAAAGAVAIGTAAEGDALQLTPPALIPMTTGYAPDGKAGVTAACPVSQVRLLPGPFRENQRRNTSYLLFVDPDRLLRSFRLNYGLTSSARPCGGWEAPHIEIRGHNTGHLMSALALTWANTGDRAALDKGRYLVRQLAALQGRAAAAGFTPGYLSAFPESYFDRLEAGRPGLVAVLHDPQVPGRIHRSVPAGRGRGGAGGRDLAGRLGGLAHRPPHLRPHAARPGGRVRRPA